MPIKYHDAPDLRERAEEIVNIMGWPHLDFEHIGFLRSTGSAARRTIARCHALGKAMRIAMGRKKGFYLVEVISERFDKLPMEEQDKVIIHELMHIPKAFGGGFIHHNVVNDRNVKKIYHEYLKKKLERRWL
ncbi:metallopeptidase [Candidatus Pacearchaeota archaeon]|nr:metallopeptidase [Candidatus Pacearchaeota archaeon]|tara:strand:- start:9156 stop:9551 length:396 start_codon:yes stop_codon:yes gene_type:complete